MMSSTAPTIAVTAAPRAANNKRALTVGYCLAFIAMGLTTASLGPTLPGLAAQTRVGLSAVSFLFAARSLGFMLGAAGGGRLYDRRAGHALIITALGAMALLMALTPIMQSLWPLAAVVLLLGCAEGLLDVGGNTLLTWTHGTGVGPAMNALHLCYGVGAVLAPVVVARTLALKQGTGPAYWMLALLVLPAAGWLVRLPSPPVPVALPAAPTDARERAAHVPLRIALCIALFLFLYLGAEVSFGGWIYTYALRLRLSNEDGAALLTAAFWGTLTAGRLLAIPLAARFRPRTLLLADLLCALISLGIIITAHTPAAIWAGTLGCGLALASIFPTTLAFAGRHLPVTGRVTSWLIVAASAGGMLLPWLAGQLFERQGPRAAMLIIACDLIAALLVFVALSLRAPLDIEATR